MTMDQQWTAGARNDQLRRIADALEKLAGGQAVPMELATLESTPTIVPIFMFVNGNMEHDELHALSVYLKSELAAAGFNVPDIEPTVAGPTFREIEEGAIADTQPPEGQHFTESSTESDSTE